MKQKILTRVLCAIMSFLLLGTSITAYAETPVRNTMPGLLVEEDDTEESEEIEEELVPINLIVKQETTTRRTLIWESDSEQNVYLLMRATEKDGAYKKVAQVEDKTGTVEYVDTNLKIGKTYYYRVDQMENDEVINTSNVAQTLIGLLPAGNVKLSINSNNDVVISWDKVQYASGYYLSRSTKSNSGYKRIATLGKSTYKFTDKNAESGKTYYYKVRGYRKDNSAATCPLNKSTVMICHMKPAKPTVTGQYTTSQKVKLSWKAISGATNYNVYKLNSAGKYVKVDVTSKTYYYDTDVKANKTYKYKVSAYYKIDGTAIVGNKSSICSVYTSKINPNKKMVALTFDDGPGPYTQAIVNCLKKNNARATFFVIGNRVNSYKSALKSAYTNGNEIANHTYSHPTLTTLSVSSMKSQITKTDNVIEKITGNKTVLVRAPGGATNATVRKNISKPFIYWSLDTRDWETRSKSATINSVMKNVRDGDIILMHDIHYPTKEAALEIIPRLKKAGYQLVTVSEMAAARGYNLKKGTTYYSFR